MSLRATLSADMKTALKSKETDKLQAIRLILAAVKQREVDERIELTDADILQILDKMAKQRRESITQYQQAGRAELEAQEQFELDLIQSYLPQPLSDNEINALIQEIIVSTGASSVQDMGKVMGQLKPKVQGRVDMAQVGVKIKALLSD